MSSKRRSTPEPQKRCYYQYPQNPENPPHMKRMQKLLDEYDQENLFLNQQILELLSQNKVLQQNNADLKANKFMSAREKKLVAAHKRLKSCRCL